MKIKKYILFLILSILLTFSIGNKLLLEKKVLLVENQSYFNDYIIKDNKVIIEFYLTFKNNSSNDENVTLAVYLPEDAKSGLLLEEKLYSINNEEKQITYLIPANGVVSYTVKFTGECGGYNVKNNRLLPKIEISFN